MNAVSMPPLVASQIDPLQPARFEHDPDQWNHPCCRSGLRLRGGALTHPGLQREHNEDSLLLRPDAGVFAVADGLGGHNAGEVASELAMRILDAQCDYKPLIERLPRTLYKVVEEANDAIYRSAQSADSLRGMGTTLSAIWFCGERVVVGHVGDSRVYRLRQGVLMQLSEDHTLLAEAIRDGLSSGKAHALIPNNIITRAVGVRRRVAPMLASCSVQAGDRFLLCSDGLSDVVSEALLRKRLALWPEPDQAASTLVEDALAAGGPDNITAIVIDVG